MNRNIVMAVAGAFLVSSCTVSTSSRVNIDPTDIQYTKDPRTSLCFAIVASQKELDTDTSGIGLANVPCTPEVLKLIN